MIYGSDTKIENVETLYTTTTTTTTKRQKEEGLAYPPDAFCNTCRWIADSKYTCGKRAAFLMSRYKMTKNQAISTLFDQGTCIDPSYNVATTSEEYQVDNHKINDTVATTIYKNNSKTKLALVEAVNANKVGYSYSSAIISCMIAVIIIIILMQKRMRTRRNQDSLKKIVVAILIANTINQLSYSLSLPSNEGDVASSEIPYRGYNNITSSEYEIQSVHQKQRRRHTQQLIAEGKVLRNNTITVDLDTFCNVATHTLPSDTFVTIFIMTRDRISSLQQSLDSYKETIQSPYEIVILDHNSSYPPMVNYLNEIQVEQDIPVIPLNEKTWDLALKESSGIIKAYLNLHPKTDFFVFTDPDIAFIRTLPDVLLFYAGLLSSCPGITSVGPGLQISDIPKHFTTTAFGGKSVIKDNSWLWTSVPNIATWNGVGFHITKQPIDTTFAMFRRGTDFGRLAGPSLRAYAPYAAVHVDWYYDSNNLPPDKVYYTKRQSGKVNNW